VEADFQPAAAQHRRQVSRLEELAQHCHQRAQALQREQVLQPASR
jgi:hypothetical protein